MGGGNKRESNDGIMSMLQRGLIKKMMKENIDLGEQSVGLNLLKKKKYILLLKIMKKQQKSQFKML